jgi:hypothetical protein
MAKSAEYTKDQQGNTQVFHVTPAPPLKYSTAIGIGVFCLVAALGSLSSGLVGFALFFMAMGAICVWAGFFRDIRPRPHREPRTFQASPSGIEVDGRTFKRDDIHRLIIKNGMSDQMLTTWNPAQAVLMAPHKTALSKRSRC